MRETHHTFFPHCLRLMLQNVSFFRAHRKAPLTVVHCAILWNLSFTDNFTFEFLKPTKLNVCHSTQTCSHRVKHITHLSHIALSQLQLQNVPFLRFTEKHLWKFWCAALPSNLIIYNYYWWNDITAFLHCTKSFSSRQVWKNMSRKMSVFLMATNTTK